MRSGIIILLAVAFLASSRSETETHANPGVIAIITQSVPGQRIAQERADYMAEHNYRSHPSIPGSQWNDVPGATFEGVGWSRRGVAHKNVPTCRPSGTPGRHDDTSRELLGDAVSYSKYGSFRVRIWGNQ